MRVNLDRVRDLFATFDFARLFIEELHWSQPKALPSRNVTIDAVNFTAKPIAQLAGVVVLEVTASDGDIPDAKTRAALHKEIAKAHYENLLIFIDQERNKSVWYWIKRENGKELARPHEFRIGQPGDLFLGKIGPLVFDEYDFASGDPSVVEVARRLRLGLDVEEVTKKFYKEYQAQHLQFIGLISGIADDRQRRWYASVLLNRLMFIWFLQRKGFIDDANLDYLQTKLEESRSRGKDSYFRDFLKLLFFEGFAKPDHDRSPEAKARLGNIRYLNGGLFLPHAIEQSNPDIDVPDRAFENLFALFRRFNWNLNDTPGSDSDEMNPDVLGYIFEKYINQKAFGAYYTRPEITTYLCERTIHRLILDAVNTPEELKKPGLAEKIYAFKTIGDLILGLDNFLCRRLLFEVLPKLSILDPACGSGAFLVAAMKTLMNVYGALTGFAGLNGDADLKRRMRAIAKDHPSINYYIKKSIITNNLYGVDLMEEAVEIARLRLFLTLVSSAHAVEDLEPLPNIDFNLLAGNSLIGLLRVDEQKFDEQTSFLRKTYRQVVDEKTRQVAVYRDATSYATDLRKMRDDIDKLRAEARTSLDDILLQQFKELGIKYEQATWDDKKQREGKGIKRPLTVADIEDLQPFHWGYEFDEIVNKRGGFDAIITNPPWDTFKPYPKEFFEQHSELVSKKSMNVHEFEEAKVSLLLDDELRRAWFSYLSRFPHQNAWFRNSQEFGNQTSYNDGVKISTDLNLYKLFLERCFHLLRSDADCGVVIPSSIYTDLGAKHLREMLFDLTEVTGLFCFENRREIFEGVHRSYKFVVLTFRKGGRTSEFPAAFMRLDVDDLTRFPQEGALPISIELIRRMSPDSLSISEFNSPLDVAIAQKMIRHPLLSDETPGTWTFELHREFHITDDAGLFKNSRALDTLPLFEGKMIHQFDSAFSPPRSFVKEAAGAAALQRFGAARRQEYLHHRIGYRRVGRSTDERAMIATVLPRRVFAADSITLCATASVPVQCYIVAVLNSFVYDWFVRLKISATLNMFYVYQTPVPRLTRGDSVFEQLATRTATLVNTGAEFDELAREVGIDSVPAASDPEKRAQVRAEIDAIVAHLYGLTEDEFRHILRSFPLVAEDVKARALETFRSWKPPSDDPLLRLIGSGESSRLEFKSSARWDIRQSQVNKAMEHIIVKTIAAFMNSDGGTLLIGVADDGSILGLANDFQTFGSKANADAFENWLMTRLLEAIDRDRIRLLRVTFQTIEGKTVCRVDVDRSSRAVYIADEKGAEKFYIRAGNSTRELSISEAHAYVDEHFRARAISAVSEERTPEQAMERRSDSPVRQDGKERRPDSLIRPDDESDWRVRPTSDLPAANPDAPTDATPPKSGAQAQLPMQAPTVRRNVDLSAHGLFRKQTAKPAAASASAAPETDDDADGASPRRSIIDAYETEEVLAIIREVITTADPMPHEDAIKAIATQLGAERVGARIRDFIDSMLNTASRRLIIETRDGGLVACTKSIDDYHRDFLKTTLKAVITRTWIDESDALRAATRHLGFRRTGPKIEQAFKSAINGLLRQNELERSGGNLRRTIQ
ncbi:MAG: hypothetical protein QOK37_1901 [Thermoanaerobaculia bacterium]|jgi:hypothetical protein|nr:hypothetical protein [Thermoanaerobaculia bacterium]